MRNAWSVACWLALCSGVLSYEKDMTVTVEAGRTDCFYQHAGIGEVIDLEYQVIDTSMGELEISFQLTEPAGRVILADYKKPENSHRHTATLAGDYRFCFDNTFSTFSTKTVFFDLVIEAENADNGIDYDEDKEMELHGDGAQNYLMRVGDILESVNRVREHVTRARRLQEQVSAHEARDRNLAEDVNFNVWRISAIHLFFIVAILFMQCILLKRLFGWESTLLIYLVEQFTR